MKVAASGTPDWKSLASAITTYVLGRRPQAKYLEQTLNSGSFEFLICRKVMLHWRRRQRIKPKKYRTLELVFDGTVRYTAILIEYASIRIENLRSSLVEYIANSEWDDSAIIVSSFNAITVLKINCNYIVY